MGHEGLIGRGTWTIRTALQVGAGLLLCLAACSSTIARFGTVTPLGTPPAGQEMNAEGVDVQGRSCATALLFVPLGKASIERALTDALKDHPGHVLARVRIREVWWTGVIVGRLCYVVEGTVLNSGEGERQ
jgi:hypothetical protein